MHHSPDKSLAEKMSMTQSAQQIREALGRQGALARELKPLGPTGKYPGGKLTEHDEGELLIGLVMFKGKIVMDFGKPIQSLGFGLGAAEDLANSIKKLVSEERKQERRRNKKARRGNA